MQTSHIASLATFDAFSVIGTPRLACLYRVDLCVFNLPRAAMAFLKEGLSKIMHAVKGEAEPAARYNGSLCADSFKTHSGLLLGSGNGVPRTLAYLPSGSLIGFCTTAGHVRLVSADHEVTLQNPAAPLQPEFLIFPRCDLVLLVGVATTVPPDRSTMAQSSSSAPTARASWMAQWWEFRGDAHRGPQGALLRFGVTCTATAEDACLVFFGTDEGDVRMFDAGEAPHVASYCISWMALHNHRKAPSMACPIAAIATVPHSAPELLVATGDGGLVLWAFDKHRVSRTYDCSSPIVSLVWCSSGSHFIAASRSDMTIFNRSSSSALTRVVLPGGPSQQVDLLRWSVKDVPSVPNDQLSKGLGELLLLRSMPNAALLLLSGDSWSQVDSILSDVASVVLCSSVDQARCGCPCFPSTVFPEHMSAFGGREEADSWHSAALALAVQSPTNAISIVSLKDGRARAWPATWGSLPLVDTSCVQLLPRKVLRLDETQGYSAGVAGTDISKSGRSNSRPQHPELQWAVRDGFLQDGVDFHSVCPQGLPPTDGWFVCTGCDNTVDEPSDVPGGDRLRWDLAGDTQLLECEVSFSLDAQVDLIMWCEGLESQSMVRLDIAEQSASFGADRCEVDLGPGASHCVQIQFDDSELAVSVAIDGCILPWQLPRLRAMCWHCQQGELRLRYMFSRAKLLDSTDVAPDPLHLQDAVGKLPPARLVETLFAHHLAHFDSFVEGKCVKPSPQPFVESWALLAGGCQGLLCSGHKDGRIRIWLRSHASVLLVYVLSVRPQASLPWRPHYQLSELTEKEPFAAFAACHLYDGVDACPAFHAGEAPESAVTAVALDLEAGALVAGCSSGEVVLFVWQGDANTLTPAEAAEWKRQSLVIATQEGKSASESEPPDLPPGFACSMRLRQHQACVTRVMLVCEAEALHVLSVDAASHFCVVDCSNGQLLFTQSLPRVVNEVAASQGPQPPRETLDAIAVSSCVLQMARSSPTHTASAVDITKLKMELLAKDVEPTAREYTYLLAFSSGELRQVAGPPGDLKLLDGRIKETRLPQLAGGVFLGLLLRDEFLLTIQASELHLFKREVDKLQSAGLHLKFSSRVMAAGMVEFGAELCLYAMLLSGQLDIVALPSLQPIVSLPVGPSANRALKGQAQSDQVGACSGESFCPDGYFALQCAGALWIGGVSDLKECKALEASVQAAHAAYLLQTLQQPSVTPSEQPERSSKPPGILGALFGRSTQKTLRECALPADPLPAEVDGNRVDNGRGLVPAWQTQARPQSAPEQPATQRTRHAAAGVREALAGATASAVERGEKISSLANNSRRLAENADQFLDLAKQLNSQQNRWF